jgi:hypothetical protein
VTENIDQRMQDTYKAATGTGWITFAGVMFFIYGTFHIIDGIAALSTNNQIQHAQLFWNLKFWGVVWLIFGVLGLYAGYGILSGSGGARAIGIVLASVNVIGQLMFINATQWWGVVLITIDFMILYALIVKGGEETA